MKRSAVFSCAAMLLVLVGYAVVAGELQQHSAIVITNDYEFTVDNGVCSGQGTLNDPYIIEDWVIDAGYDEYGIRIHRTSRAFIIRNVSISGAAKSAVYLSYVRNAMIEDCTFEGNWAGVTLNYSLFNRISGCTFAADTDGIRFYFSTQNQILGNVFQQNDTAIWLDASNINQLHGNLIADSHMGIYLNLESTENAIVDNAFVNNVHNAHTDDLNIWDDGQQGNYWSDYSAIDSNLDGIWDSPYMITSDEDRDNFPLVVHPLVPEPVAASCVE